MRKIRIIDSVCGKSTAQLEERLQRDGLTLEGTPLSSLWLPRQAQCFRSQAA